MGKRLLVWFITEIKLITLRHLHLGDALGVLKLNVAVLVDRGVELLDLPAATDIR
jgi:hypothetical protein